MTPRTPLVSSDAEAGAARGVDVTETILVAHDGSLCARAAAGLAMQVARGRGMAIRGLFVVDEADVLNAYADHWNELGERPSFASPAELVSRFGTAGARVSEWVEARCRETGLAVATGVLFGGVSQLVLQEARGCAMLALGRRGRRHDGEPGHIGRNFHAVARHTRQPILVGGDETRPVRRQLVAYDGGARAEVALAWSAVLRSTLGGETVVLVVDDGRGGRARDAPPRELEPRAARAALGDCRLVTRWGDPSAAIVDAAVEARADLIVMGGYRHRPTVEWITRSTFDAVLRATTLPVLVT